VLLGSLQGKICSGTHQWCSMATVVAATKVALSKAIRSHVHVTLVPTRRLAVSFACPSLAQSGIR
jgi:hypothetical protein